MILLGISVNTNSTSFNIYKQIVGFSQINQVRMALYLSGDIHEGILYIYICCFDIVYQNRQMPPPYGTKYGKRQKMPHLPGGDFKSCK
jgi:hypothetical protein